MVRLKADLSTLLQTNVKTFQFQYGAIKSFCFVVVVICCCCYFNSSMVRLKAQTLKQYVNVIAFQFQYGAIKSSLPPKVVTCFFLFQFQYGAIKRRVQLLDTICRSCLFQFQYGAIKRNLLILSFYISIISIPVWCD